MVEHFERVGKRIMQDERYSSSGDLTWWSDFPASASIIFRPSQHINSLHYTSKKSLYFFSKSNLNLCKMKLLKTSFISSTIINQWRRFLLFWVWEHMKSDIIKIKELFSLLSNNPTILVVFYFCHRSNIFNITFMVKTNHWSIIYTKMLFLYIVLCPSVAACTEVSPTMIRDGQ